MNIVGAIGYGIAAAAFMLLAVLMMVELARAPSGRLSHRRQRHHRSLGAAARRRVVRRPRADAAALRRRGLAQRRLAVRALLDRGQQSTTRAQAPGASRAGARAAGAAGAGSARASRRAGPVAGTAVVARGARDLAAGTGPAGADLSQLQRGRARVAEVPRLRRRRVVHLRSVHVLAGGAVASNHGGSMECARRHHCICGAADCGRRATRAAMVAGRVRLAPGGVLHDDVHGRGSLSAADGRRRLLPAPVRRQLGAHRSGRVLRRRPAVARVAGGILGAASTRACVHQQALLPQQVRLPHGVAPVHQHAVIRPRCRCAAHRDRRDRADLFEPGRHPVARRRSVGALRAGGGVAGQARAGRRYRGAAGERRPAGVPRAHAMDRGPAGTAACAGHVRQSRAAGLAARPIAASASCRRSCSSTA